LAASLTNVPQKEATVSRWIRRFLQEEPPRANSLCVTVLGDSVAPHGGAVWLGGLIDLLGPFGFNDRLVRTTVFRLTVEGWLESRREGRRSLYTLTASGRSRFEHAFRRVYAPPAAGWDGTWTLVVVPVAQTAAAASARNYVENWNGRLRRDRPRHLCASESQRFVIARDPSGDRAGTKGVRPLGRDLTGFSVRPVSDLVSQCWNLDSLAAAYRNFLSRFTHVAMC